MAHRTRLLTLIALSLVAAAPASAQDAATGENPAAAVARAYQEAFNAGQPDKLAALHTEDATWVDSDGSSLSGRDAIRAALSKAFAAAPGRTIELAVDQVRPLGDDVILEKGSSIVTGPDGEQSASFYTTVYAKEGGHKDRRPGAVPPRDRFAQYPDLAENLDRRPGGYDKWQRNREAHWDSLHSQRADRLDQFQNNRNERWDNIFAVQNNRQDFYTNRREDWQRWSNDRQIYRQDRAWEVLDNVRDYHTNLFVPDWYYRNPWWHPSLIYRPTINPWTWWRPAAWTGLAAFLGGAVVAKQLDRNYGTQVYYDQTNYYIEGQPVAPAPVYRQQALDLAAAPPSEEPFLPVENNKDDGWYPLGVWALTQEEKGDAVMFYQLAVNKQGEVSGAYNNVLTGETSPVTGRVDFATQRVAWRTGNSDSTAIEANLTGLTKEFTPVFVHYGTGQSQEWLLVRMEDPT